MPNTCGVNLTHQAADCTWMMYARQMTRAASEPAAPKALIATARAMERLRNVL